jgi:ATP-dependent DNA helicase RecG
MIEDLLGQEEGKTLEFKETTQSLAGIVKTVIAFANTAGGTLVIGVQDKTKKVVGIDNPLQEEERLANSISASISPFLSPDIVIHTYRSKPLIIIKVPHMSGPYFMKSEGADKGTYVRFGSTNRLADEEKLESLKMFSRKITFDSKPFLGKVELLDFAAIKHAFEDVNREIDNKKAENLGLVVKHEGAYYPSNGGIVLFGTNRAQAFPYAIIKCVRFADAHDMETRALNSAVIKSYPQRAIDEAVAFVRQNTVTKSVIGRVKRVDIPQYPPIAIREAITNAVVHADYSMGDSAIRIGIFDDRIEISNPGGLIYGLTLEEALTGASKIRNRVIAEVFFELKLIEQWGSGLKAIVSACEGMGLMPPKFEDRTSEFRVTLFAKKTTKRKLSKSHEPFLDYLREKKRVSTKDAAEFWGIATRTAREKLKLLLEAGFITRVGTSVKDPQGTYILVQGAEA